MKFVSPWEQTPRWGSHGQWEPCPCMGAGGRYIHTCSAQLMTMLQVTKATVRYIQLPLCSEVSESFHFDHQCSCNYKLRYDVSSLALATWISCWPWPSPARPPCSSRLFALVVLSNTSVRVDGVSYVGPARVFRVATHEQVASKELSSTVHMSVTGLVVRAVRHKTLYLEIWTGIVHVSTQIATV